MNLSLIRAYYEQAAQAERFWRGAYKDADAEADRREFGWLWIQYQDLRLRLEAIIAEREATMERPTNRPRGSEG